MKKHGITYETKRPWIGWLNEYSGTGPRSATTPFMRIGSTLVHWKTATDAGKVHKVKELSARVRNVRYQYQKGKFSHREGIQKFFLIIDGTFTEKDLTNLSRAGWDQIFYADQMDELVQVIV